MTIPILETSLDLVDATDLYIEWQNKYGKIFYWQCYITFLVQVKTQNILFCN